jgi:ATP-dependent Clp protease ATP-binding subunit ClpA
MARLLQEKIKQPLAEELLFGKLANGGEVKVRIKDNVPAFEISPAPPKESKATKGKAAPPTKVKGKAKTPNAE